MNTIDKCFVNALLPLSNHSFTDEMKSFNNSKDDKENTYWVARVHTHSIVKQGKDMPKEINDAISIMAENNLILASKFLAACTEQSSNDELLFQQQLEKETLAGYNYPLY